MSLIKIGRTYPLRYSIMSESNDYTYVYELMVEHAHSNKIPLDSLVEVLTYFEGIEDYEKCEILNKIIESHK